MFTRTMLLAGLTGVLFLAARPAAAEFRLERRLPLQPGGQFVLDSDVGSLAVTGDASAEAIVTVTSREDDLDRRYGFRFDQDTRRVTLTIERHGGWIARLFGGWFRDRDVLITVRVPRETAVVARTSGGSVKAQSLVGDARLRTSGGSVEINALDGNLEAGTSGGSIRVKSVRGTVDAGTSGGNIDLADIRGQVHAKTSGGSIQIDGVTDEIVARTSGGNVRVREAGGRVEAHSSGGQITVGFARGNDRGGVLSTSGGGIRAEVDPSVALSIDASSSGGRVSTDVPVTTRVLGSFRDSDHGRTLRGDLNGSGSVLRLRTSGGGIRIVSALEEGR
jgi:hypothetical protein